MDGEASVADHEFTCPDCGQHIEVNDSMREAILANGCPVCSSAVSEDAFDDA